MFRSGRRTRGNLPVRGALGLLAGASGLFAILSAGSLPASAVVVRPGATTEAATSITATTAQLDGSVNPNGAATSYSFEYGTTTAYLSSTGSFSAGSGTTSVAVAIAVSSLLPGTEYFAQLIATNGVRSRLGGEVTFITPPAAPTAATSSEANTTNSGSVSATNDCVTATSTGAGGIRVAQYASDPGAAVTFGATSEYFDVAISTDNSITSVLVTDCNLNGGTTLWWLDGGVWEAVVGDPGPTYTGGSSPSVSVTLNSGTSPNLTELAGTVFAVAKAGTPLPAAIYGPDAIGTSIAISQEEFPATHSAGAVVLARDDYFSDALAGGPLAAAVNGPLLLSEGADESPYLDPRTQAEIQRVLPLGGTVYILGGDQALSPNVDPTLEGLGYAVVREAGADEYATAFDIAQQIATTSWGTPSTVFEATGLSFYDALSAVPAAIQQHAAILLTNGPDQSLPTYVYLVEHPGDTVYAIGGPSAAGGADQYATDIYGQDLFNTSAAVASYFFPSPSIFGIASAADFPDATGGGVFMATGGRMGPLLLVNPTLPLPPEITPYLAGLAVGSVGYVFGGALAVAGSVLTALQAAVG